MPRTSARCHALARSLCAALLFAALSGCERKESAQSSYYERTIAPVLVSSCVRTNTGAGCHVVNDKGNAFGNLDTSTFAQLAKRRDLLADYGPYGQPALLLKVIDPFAVQVQSFDGRRVTVTTDVKHTGGSIFEPTASAYQTVRRWLQNGATENNTGTAPNTVARLPCVRDVPTAAGFDPANDPARADFQTFRGGPNELLARACAAGNCHGTKANALYLTCGDAPEQVRWNYHVARSYLAPTAEQSELLRRPLAPSQGGAFHEGGAVFASQNDAGYAALEAWASEHGAPEVTGVAPEFLFFAHRVQPVLVKKGCMMLQCHSGAQFHDYRLHAGAAGTFSLPATRRNYDLSLLQVSIESEDPDASRMVRKNLYRREVSEGGKGITHRGGPLFEDFGGAPATPAACDAAKPDYDNGNLDTIPGYCVVREWIRRERAARQLAPLSGIVYVRRPLQGKGGRVQDFDVYEKGADLRRIDAVLDAEGRVQVGTDRSLTAGCGLSVASADIRRPAVSWDGATIAFAARPAAGEPLAVYTLSADGSACMKHPQVNAGAPSANGLLVHNFDPAFAPPDAGGRVALVFASTRGNLEPEGVFDYTGPQRTPADPTKANANLYALEGGNVRQLTFLLNTERQPSFMIDGRLIMTAEKRAPGFYQLSGRRMNLDGGDYHPLFGQRPTVGATQFTDVVELADKNFAAIFSEPSAASGGGALGIVNRSIGVDFQSPNESDYLVDPSVLDPAAPQSPEPSFFLRSLHFPDGRRGAYRSPAALPSTRFLVSHGAASDVATFAGDFDVYEMDANGQKRKLFGVTGSAEVEAVAIYGRATHGIFASALDEPNGHTRVLPDRPEVEVTYLDVPVLGSLLFQNTPTGRVIEEGMASFELWEDMPPPLDVTSFAAGGANVAKDAYGQVYVRRRLLGQVPLAADGSAKVRVPGGVPLVMKLPETATSRARNLPRVQREATVFTPGEEVHQSFRRGFFDGLCAQCHGAVSGRPIDVALRPDVLTQASSVLARDAPAVDLLLPPEQRRPVEGPPAGP